MLQRFLALLLIFAFSSPTLAETAPSQRLHEIRTHGFLLCSNLLVYFNNHDPDSTFDPQAREAYRQNLASMQKLIEGAPENLAMTASLQQMKSAIDQIEQQPQDAMEQYSRWINSILRAHAELEKAAESAYLKTHETAQATVTIHQQSMDISRMLLLYETQAFIGLGIFAMEFHEDLSKEIDQQIDSRHATLLELLPSSHNELEKVRRDYSFIRSRLLSPDREIVSRSAAIYLGRSIEQLNNLAKTSVVSAR